MSNVETIASMFEGAASFNQELGSWDTSNIVDARRLFAAARSFNDGSIASWDVSRMVNLDGMFFGASSFNGDLRDWSLTSAKSLRQMFAEAGSFHQDLCAWKKYVLLNEPVTSGMFDKSGCPSSANPFVTVRDIGPLCHYCSNLPCNEDTSLKCLPLIQGGEFRKAIAAYRQDSSRYTAVASIYGHPIGKWNTSLLQDFSYAFFKDDKFTDDISSWDTSNAINMASMFNGACWFRGDLSSWDVSRVIYTSDMFKNAEWFNQDISMWNLSRIHYADRMFYGATRFNQNLCEWRSRFLFNGTRRVDEMFSFSGCPIKSSPLQNGSGPYCHECLLGASPTSSPEDSSDLPTTFTSTDYPTVSTKNLPMTSIPTSTSVSPAKVSSRFPSVYPSMTPVIPQSSAPSIFPTLANPTTSVANSTTSIAPTSISFSEDGNQSGDGVPSVNPTSKLSAVPTLLQIAPDSVPSVRPSPSAMQTLTPSNTPPASSSSESSRCTGFKRIKFTLCILFKIMG